MEPTSRNSAELHLPSSRPEVPAQPAIPRSIKHNPGWRFISVPPIPPVVDAPPIRCMKPSTPLKRARTVDDDESPSGNGGGRHTRHASRACEGCRSRRYRCDGAGQACSHCASRGQQCRWSQRVDRRRAIDKAQADEFNKTIEGLETELRNSAKENELLNYKVAWLIDRLAQFGHTNLPIPTELPEKPFAISTPSLAVSIPDSPAASPPFLSASISPGSSLSSASQLPSPFYPSPLDPSVALPDVDNTAFLTVGFRPRAVSDGRPPAGAFRVAKGRRTSAPSLPHPNKAMNSGYPASGAAHGLNVSAPSITRESGVEHITTMFGSTALASPAAALSSSLYPPGLAPALHSQPRGGPTRTTTAFDRSSSSSSSSRISAPSPSSSTLAGATPPPLFYASFMADAYDSAPSPSPILRSFGSSSPSLLDDTIFVTRAADTSDAESGSVLFSPTFPPSFEDNMPI
ncbi:hypothetical protein EXIGLDRAFT_791537 [Exidia glandulosa HHB12029]|uniref:Zn(2)-C6 fungal-type domain-containing protein n=1 Tax=Exidia glandulosa HHB12029 TaxID=1314781 RepID=A0A165HDE5_EXIGL|nr:hypothetical protein EXIGLDRAFT_791537 [Exidia glandulosa HHB12029]